MSQVMDSDPFDTGLLAASTHFVMEIGLGDWEHSDIICNAVQRINVVLDFVHEKIGHLDVTNTLGRFRVRDDIFRFARLGDKRDKSFRRIKKAPKSNQKQLDLRAMRHFGIILVKKLMSSNCPRGTFGEPKKPCKSRVFGFPWVIPTLLTLTNFV